MTIIAYFFLNEAVMVSEIIAIVICFSAVVVIGFDTQKQDSASESDEYD